MDRRHGGPRRAAIWTLVAVAVLAAPGVDAMSIERAEARYADRRYHFELIATLEAPLDQVRSVLTDYEHYPQLDPKILESQVLERPEAHVALLQTTLRMCLGPFCRNVRRVERVEESPSALSAVADPERSDVSSGETHTQLTAVEGGTQVTYRTSIAPSFWIPAVIGRRWMLNTLSEATVELFRRVELHAQELSRLNGPPAVDESDAL